MLVIALEVHTNSINIMVYGAIYIDYIRLSLQTWQYITLPNLNEPFGLIIPIYINDDLVNTCFVT